MSLCATYQSNAGTHQLPSLAAIKIAGARRALRHQPAFNLVAITEIVR